VWTVADQGSLFDGLDTVLLRVRDVDAAEAWYREKLGLTRTFADPGERLVVLDVGGPTSLTLWQLKAGEVAAGAGTARSFPIFRVAEARGTRQALRERGVRCGDFVDGGGVISFQFFDPDDNVLEACQVT
jgi:catechol 2,3-dioxygenase-like lactoylglutathione lyase family enzyme